MTMFLSKDFLSGLMFLAIGIGVVLQAQSYPFGTPLRMGPGFFPTMIGGLTVLTGLLLLGKALMVQAADRPDFALRPLVLITAGIVAFAFALERVGLVIATILLVVIVRLASRPMNWLGSLMLSGWLVLMSILIFWYLLGMPLRLWP